MTLRITEAELVRDVRAVLDKIERGNEVIIEREDHRPLAVMKQPQPVGRKINECIALAKAYEQKLGYAPIPDEDFARDVQYGIDAHREPIRNVWDEKSMGAGLQRPRFRRASWRSAWLNWGTASIEPSRREQAAKHSRYLEMVFAAIPAELFTRHIGHVVAQVDAEALKQGWVIPVAVINARLADKRGNILPEEKP